MTKINTKNSLSVQRNKQMRHVQFDDNVKTIYYVPEKQITLQECLEIWDTLGEYSRSNGLCDADAV